MKTIDTIQFIDIDSNEESHIIIRASKDHIALCITKRTDGDIEAVFHLREGEKLLEALHRAVAIAKNA